MSSRIARDKEPEFHEFRVEYRRYKTTLTKKYLERKPWKPVDPSQVLAFIPGTITEIYVKEGDKVEAGEKLMILEAMKMKNTVHAELAGTVKKVLVKVGDRVPKNEVVFEIV